MKRSYHTDILIQYKLGILPLEILQQIPSSTIDNWKKRDINRYFGMDNIIDFEKNLAKRVLFFYPFPRLRLAQYPEVGLTAAQLCEQPQANEGLHPS